MALERTQAKAKPKDTDFSGFSPAWARVGFFGLPNMADAPAASERIDPANATQAPADAGSISLRLD